MSAITKPIILNETGERIAEAIEALQSIGRPTQEQTNIAVDEWLNDHPEATTTVQDHSLVIDKMIIGTLGYVTPEMFGAVGDGVSDDTNAWQSAVDLGLPVVAKSNRYKCGMITVSKNINIECNGAIFICTESKLFYCAGEVVSVLENAEDYTANQSDYTLAESNYADYTGFAMLKGSNNFEKSRAYYRGGFACTFYQGTLTNTYPIDVTSPNIEFIKPITVNITGIGGIEQRSDSSDPAISFIYGYGCTIKNSTMESPAAYNVILFDSCLNCIVDNCNIAQDYGSVGSNSYLIDIGNSSFCNVRNCYLYNKYWHCITTGGTWLCYHNTIDNCKTYTNTATSIDDHENALNTIISNSVCACIQVSGMGIVTKTNIVSTSEANGSCYIRMCAMSDLDRAIYTLKDIRLIPQDASTSGYCGIRFTSPSNVASVDYYVKDCNIDNVKCVNRNSVAIGRFDFASNVSNHIHKISIRNSNIDVMFAATSTTATYIDIAKYELTISECTAYRYITSNNVLHQMIVGGSNYKFGSVYVSESDLRALDGTYANLYISNVSVTNNITTSLHVTGAFYGSGIHCKIAPSALVEPAKLRIADYVDGSTQYFNVAKGNDDKVYQQHYVDGVLTTTEVAA